MVLILTNRFPLLRGGFNIFLLKTELSYVKMGILYGLDFKPEEKERRIEQKNTSNIFTVKTYEWHLLM